jgi:predicted ArsR family transcriptional regulator
MVVGNIAGLNTDERVLNLLASRGAMTIDQIAADLGLGYVSVRGSAERLRARGVARVTTATPGTPETWEVSPASDALDRPATR